MSETQKRSVFIVRLVQSLPQLDGYGELVNGYWNAVRTQLERLEISSGPIKHVFAETVIGRGEDALVMLGQMNPEAQGLVRGLISSGSVFEDLEDADIFHELIDWSQCASQQLMSEKVRGIVESGHRETVEARTRHLSKRLDEGIGEGDSAVILTVSETIPIPSDVERYIISPPELDRLERWLQAKMQEAQRMMMNAEAEARSADGEADGGGESSSGQSGGGLWTPP